VSSRIIVGVDLVGGVRCTSMSDAAQVLQRIEQGDPTAADLLPPVYDELRKLAAAKLAQEKPG
jgi:hypothetical protein